jgi:hypothetical protein
MRTRIVGAIVAAALLLVGLVPSVAAGPSCTAQFVGATVHVAHPFGRTVVAPEAHDLTLGGPNLGQEVKVLFATADKEACPPIGG